MADLIIIRHLYVGGRVIVGEGPLEFATLEKFIIPQWVR